MARSRADIEAEIERLNAELNDTAEEIAEVIEEAAEETEEAIEDAAEDAAEEVVEAIEDAAEDAVEDAPLIDTPDAAAAAIAARVVADLESRYDLTPRVVVEHTEHHVEEVIHDEAPEETAPHSEHWSRRRVF